MKKAMFRWLVVMTIMLTCLLPTVAATERAVTDSGTVGDGLTWTLYEDGELAIQGTGAMPAWTSTSGVPWLTHRASIKTLTIAEGVTSIGGYAFFSCTELSAVSIADSVTSIGESAFLNCKALTSVAISNGVTDIGAYAFRDCSNLDCVDFGSSVANIGKYAFYNCTSLSSVTIPESLASIGSDAFRSCAALTDVYYNGDLAGWCGIAFENGEASPTYYAGEPYIGGKRIDGKLVIPNGITCIAGAAFRNCTELTSVVIPDSVERIGNQAFAGCTGLTELSLGCNVSEIGYYAFYYCPGLTDFDLPDSLKNIGECAFGKCSALTAVTIPDSVEQLGNYVFSGCTNLCSIDIGNGVISIGSYAFQDCDGLTSLTIPASVAKIGDGAFRYCPNLVQLEFIGDAPSEVGNYIVDTSKRPTAYRYSDTSGWPSSDLWMGCNLVTVERCTVAVDAVLNGVLSLDRMFGKAGDVVTVTATPAKGYFLKSILVDGAAITGNTFIITGDHTVTAVFEQQPAAFRGVFSCKTIKSVVVDGQLWELRVWRWTPKAK